MLMAAQDQALRTKFESRNTAIRRRTTANMCEIKNIYKIPIFRPALQDFFRAVM